MLSDNERWLEKQRIIKESLIEEGRASREPRGIEKKLEEEDVEGKKGDIGAGKLWERSTVAPKPRKGQPQMSSFRNDDMKPLEDAQPILPPHPRERARKINRVSDDIASLIDTHCPAVSNLRNLSQAWAHSMRR